MDSGAANLILSHDQNLTSAVGSCSRTYMVLKLIKNSMFVICSFPIYIFVIVELLKRNYRQDSSITSTSLSEVALLHINFICVCYCVGELLLPLVDLHVCQISGHFLDALYCPCLSALPLFLVAICVDCYLAVVHPVAYMAIKNTRHRPLLCTAPVWVYAFVIWLITVIYNLNYYHPVCMMSFYVSLPAVMFFSISTLRVLYSAKPGSSNQTLSPAKRRAFRIILSILVGMVVYYMPQVCFFTYRFIEPTDSGRFLCHEYPLVMLLPTVCDFASPLLFLYCVGKLRVTFCSFKT